jgi:hypothetical protein
MDNRLIGHRFHGSSGSSPGYGKAITFASFQDMGNCESRMLWLIKRVKWTSGLLAMSSIPQAFHSFREFIDFCKSHSLILSGGSLSTALSRAWAPVSSCCLWFPSYHMLADHVTLNFNNKMSTAAVFLDIEKSFDTPWHPGLLYKLSKLNFSIRIIKLISSFLLQRKFRVSVEGEMSTPRCMQAGVPQGSVLSPTLYNLFTNDTPPPNYRCKSSSPCG